MNWQTKPVRVEVFHMTAEAMADRESWPDWVKNIRWAGNCAAGNYIVVESRFPPRAISPCRFAFEHEPAPDPINLAPFVPPFRYDGDFDNIKDSRDRIIINAVYVGSGDQIAAALNRAASVKGGAK